MAKPNYQYEKRQKELAKKNKQEEKRQKKLKDAADGGSPDSSASVTDAAPTGPSGNEVPPK